MHLFLGATTMPDFPTVDLASGIKWFTDGFTGIISSNAGVIIMSGIAIAGITGAIWAIRRFGKKAVKG